MGGDDDFWDYQDLGFHMGASVLSSLAFAIYIYVCDITSRFGFHYITRKGSLPTCFLFTLSNLTEFTYHHTRFYEPTPPYTFILPSLLRYSN